MRCMKKDRAIVFTVSNNLTFAVSSIMMDIQRLSPNIVDEIVILHNGIILEDQKLLSSILPTRFIKYVLPFEDRSFIPDRILDYFTEMVFAKFECLKLLNDYKNVMLLDYDMVIQSDISELFDRCETGIKMMPSESIVREQLHCSVEEYNMTNINNCACLFILQDHLKNYNNMYDFCYKSLEKYADVIYLPEQAIFDFMLQEFNLQILPIDSRIYSPHPKDDQLAPQAKIIHAYGQPKFWNGLENEQWNNNYSKWIKMGGTKYKKPKLIHKMIKRIKKLFRK